MTLKQYLRLTNHTDAQFAALVGVSQPAVNKWRNGLAVPRPAQMKKIIVATEGAVGPADFFDGFSHG